MNIIHTFGDRKYILHSEKDIQLATHFWAQPCNQDEFENLLEDNKVDFEYST